MNEIYQKASDKGKEKLPSHVKTKTLKEIRETIEKHSK
jgi:hypothetical protein